MGYTHYFYRPEVLDAARFKAWTNDVRTILANLPKHSKSAGGYYAKYPLRVAGPMGDGQPEITDTLVSFNGDMNYKPLPGHQPNYDRDMSHETFYVEQTFDEGYRQADERGWLFAFCKTARKPYDLAVTAALIRLAYHFPEGVEVASDGDVSEWEEGRQLCETLFGYAVVPFTDERVAA